MPVSAEGRVEHQKLNQTAAPLSFGWVFGVQLDSLEKVSQPTRRHMLDFISKFWLLSIWTVEYLLSPHPPKLWTQITTTTEPFQTFTMNHHRYTAIFGFTFLCFFGFTFLCFLEKTLIFWIYTTKSCFIKIVQKIDFISWNPILSHFFTKNNVVPLYFFQILIKIHGLWTWMKIWEKN